MTVDPLDGMTISSQSYEVEREAYIHYSKQCSMAWTNAYFNGRETPERTVAIPLSLAEKAVTGQISKDEWLRRFFPKQMAICEKAAEESRQQLFGF